MRRVQSLYDLWFKYPASIFTSFDHTRIYTNIFRSNPVFLYNFIMPNLRFAFSGKFNA